MPFYRSSDSGGVSSGCSEPSSRTSVSSNSVMVTTPGAASSITSTVTVLTVEMLGGFTTLALFRATCFAPVRLGLALARPFRVFDLVAVRLVALPRVGSRVGRPGCALLTFFSLGSLASSVEPSWSSSDLHSKDCQLNLANLRMKQGRNGVTVDEAHGCAASNHVR